MRRFISIVLILCLILCIEAAETVFAEENSFSLICVGDSLTFGVIPRTPGKRDITYPDTMAKLLGDSYGVLNLGKPGASLTEAGVCFRNRPEYQQSIDAAADMYIIMFGTNDSNLWDLWDEAAFENDLNNMVDTYKEANPDTIIVLIAPPTVLPDEKTGEIKMDKSLLEGTIRDIVKRVSEEKRTIYIDMYAKTVENPEWIGEDGIHFTQEGYTAFGEFVYENIKDFVPTEINSIDEFEIEETHPIVIGCVGDSITFGSGAEKREEDSYPALLQTLLGDGYEVDNFGCSGGTLQAEGDNPYRIRKPFDRSLEAKAQIYIIMLGTNDCKEKNWNPERYEAQWPELLDAYKEGNPDVKFILMTPPHAYIAEGKDSIAFDIHEEYLDEAAEIVTRIGEEYDIPVVDIRLFTEDKPEWFVDGIHPNNEGYKVITQYIYDSILPYVA